MVQLADEDDIDWTTLQWFARLQIHIRGALFTV